MHNTLDSGFHLYHYVFVVESGCDKRTGSRRMGWSPLGVTPIQIARFQREQRYQILPAYTHDGVILARVYQGSTDSTVFEDFIEQLLPLCGRWPEPKLLTNVRGYIIMCLQRMILLQASFLLGQD